MEALELNLPEGTYPNDLPRGLPLGEFEAFVLAGLRFGLLCGQAEDSNQEEPDHGNWEPFRL